MTISPINARYLIALKEQKKIALSTFGEMFEDTLCPALPSEAPGADGALYPVP